MFWLYASDQILCSNSYIEVAILSVESACDEIANLRLCSRYAIVSVLVDLIMI